MFIGHFALGFAAKRKAPHVSLAVLFAAAQLADLLWPIFVAVGIEQVRIAPGNTALTPLDFVSYPYSHSLLMLIVWGIVLGVLFRSAFAVILALVLSHWMLDWITHRPDMPLYPGGPKFGLGLWNFVPAAVTVEVVMFAAGVWIYAQTTRARDAVGRWSFVVFVLFLLAIYAGNIFSAPPPGVAAIWIASLAGGAILLVWSARFDRHRDPR
jgi:LexA-binding, inner membrane-associated putative hydrolase